MQNAVQRSAFWAEKSAKPNFVIHTDEEIETTTSTASSSCATTSLAEAAASLATSLATRERVPLGALPMPKPVIKDDAVDDEFGYAELKIWTKIIQSTY